MSARYLPIASVVVALGALDVACGSLDGHTGAPTTLATVQGNLTLAADAPSITGNVHIAVIWGQQNAPQTVKVAVDLPVKPVFPSKYVLALTEPPPQSAMVRDPNHPEFSFAFGALVAYEDLNGNGQLDLVSDDAGSFPDRVVGTNPQDALLYLDSTTGRPPPPDYFNVSSGTQVVQSAAQGTPLLGYNIFQERECTTTVHANLPDGGLSAPDMTVCTPLAVLPMSTPYDLPFSNNPDLNLLACQGAGGSTGNIATGIGPEGLAYWDVNDAGPPSGGYPAPGAQNLYCPPGGLSYEYQACHTTGPICAPQTVCDMAQQVSLGGAAKPDGWPCP